MLTVNWHSCPNIQWLLCLTYATPIPIRKLCPSSESFSAHLGTRQPGKLSIILSSYLGGLSLSIRLTTGLKYTIGVVTVEWPISKYFVSSPMSPAIAQDVLAGV